MHSLCRYETRVIFDLEMESALVCPAWGKHRRIRGARQETLARSSRETEKQKLSTWRDTEHSDPETARRRMPIGHSQCPG